MRDNQIDITIVVPVYNVPELLLRRCLESLYEQSYTRLEFIVVNDGSSDPVCEKLPLSFAKMDKRFKYISQDNRGVSSARNTGVNNASGLYIMFVDGDDSLSVSAIDYVISTIKKNKADSYIFGFSVCKMDQIKTNDTERIQKIISSYEIENLIFDIVGFDTKKYTKYNLNIDSPWAKVFLLPKIKEHHISFEESLSRSEDALFCAEYFERCSSVYVDNYSIYNYVFNEESLCRKSSDTIIRMLPKICENFCKFVEQYHKENECFKSNISKLTERYILSAEEVYFFNKHTDFDLNLIKQYYEFLHNPSVRPYILKGGYREKQSFYSRLHSLCWRTIFCVPYLIFKRIKMKLQ